MIWKIACNVLDFTGDFRQPGLKKKKNPDRLAYILSLFSS